MNFDHALGGFFAAGDAGLAEVLVDDDERLRGDRVGVRVRRVDHLEAEVGRDLDADRRGAGRRERRRDELARFVLHRCVGEAVLQGVCLLDVADRADRLLDRARDARVALAAGTRRPRDFLAFADLALEFGVDVGEEAGEAGRGARGVRAVHDRDRGARQRDARVERLDRRVVPGLDRAHEDRRSSCRPASGPLFTPGRL